MTDTTGASERRNIPDERTLTWRTPTPAEREVAQRWVTAWNDGTGDDASVPDDWEAATSCACGTCPTFVFRPIALARAGYDAWLPMGGRLTDSSGELRAVLYSFYREGTVELEFPPVLNEPVTLEETTSEFWFQERPGF